MPVQFSQQFAFACYSESPISVGESVSNPEWLQMDGQVQWYLSDLRINDLNKSISCCTQQLFSTSTWIDRDISVVMVCEMLHFSKNVCQSFRSEGGSRTSFGYVGLNVAWCCRWSPWYGNRMEFVRHGRICWLRYHLVASQMYNTCIDAAWL